MYQPRISNKTSEFDIYAMAGMKHNYPMILHDYCERVDSLIANHQWDDVPSFETWWEEKGRPAPPPRRQIEAATSWLIRLILCTQPMTDPLYTTLMRLFGPQGPSEWACWIGGCEPVVPLRTIRWLVEKRGIIIDWNTSKQPGMPPLLWVALTVPEERGRTYMTYLLENGADPMLPSEDRQPLFMAYLCRVLTTNGRWLGREECLRRVELLLQFGADPMLPDGSGYTSIDLIRGAHAFTRVTAEEQEIWLSVLEREASNGMNPT